MLSKVLDSTMGILIGVTALYGVLRALGVA